MSRYRELSYSHAPNMSTLPMGAGPTTTTKEHYQLRRLANFKSYYFQIQNLINSNVSLSLKFEQLKTPEILSTLIKPIIIEIIAITDKSSSQSQPTQAHHFTDPKSRLKISTFTIYILLLLRYEYLIQSENNLICFDLLVTKANVCELLAIRMLREYRSWQRIQMLFIKPPAGLASTNTSNSGSGSNSNSNMSLMGMMDLNSLELSILSKSKRFLSQPIVIHILDRFYNGDLVHGGSCLYYQNGEYCEDEKSTLLGTRMGERRTHRGGYNVGSSGDGNGDSNSKSRNHSFTGYDNEGDINGDSDIDDTIFDDSRVKFSIARIFNRAQLVPKYQHVLINLKLINFAIVYFIMILQPKRSSLFVDLYFWLLALSFNCEVVTKLVNIDHRFMNIVIWNHIDLLFIFIIDLCFIFKFALRSPQYYHDVFSLIGIILFPRILSIFNNYRFFNLILLSFHKMIFNLVGLVLFFFTLISGFYFSFITLSQTQTKQDVLFNMLKIFFGFTPSVWNNWDDFNTLGKIMQMSYLFLIQFIVGTILAICLSGVFTKTRENIEHEFNYFKSNNLILYFKMGQLNQRGGLANGYCQLFKLPLIGIVLIYEAVTHLLFKTRRYNINNDDVDLKHFVFISNDQEYTQFNEQSSIGGVDPLQEPVAIKVNKRQAMKNHQSISTLGGGHLRTASTDSLFIDQLLNRKYGATSYVVDNKLERIQTQTQQAQVPQMNRVFSRKTPNHQRRQSPPAQQQQHQMQTQTQVPIALKKSFNVPRRGSVFSQSATSTQQIKQQQQQQKQQQQQQPSQSHPQQLQSYAPQPFFGSPPSLQMASLQQPMLTQDVLARLSNLESLFTKRIISTSIDDSKSVIMSRINEDDVAWAGEEARDKVGCYYGNRRGDVPLKRRGMGMEDDELSINSESEGDGPRSGDDVDRDGDDDGDAYDDGDDDGGDLDSEELNRTLPLKFKTLSNTEVDQYDSDETF
ncbi:hypothetical protein KGF57_004711 [Candida theae]|uniref:Calcium channel YVC1-like C-terminal transmembrane domain-containing protein n=1 Tax=Candida theae TaxID=1198502 RepID=A0AAD5BAN8_9ASCO|nr:uncharacterized protein KGF57_004711 [Candida theae]KAI5949501.1 hypothetical protein KGF57_004711 [Candida theae]